MGIEGGSTILSSSPITQRWFRLWFGFDTFVDGSHQGPCHTAVQNNGSEDEKAPSPAKRVKQKLIERSQSGQDDWTSCHSEPIGQRTLDLEVGTYDGQGWLQVLYDGLCPICVTEIRFLQFLQRNQPSKVDFIDISVPGYDEGKYQDISYEMAMEEMHVIDEKNEVHRGVPAFAVMYGAVGLGWLGRFMMWSPVRPFMDKSYAIFARNRLKWTGRGEECTTGRCEKKPH
ncbi:hypothetical protein INR49_017093 [Caranx melampygus]|nr:hypothetical protein INR49_017093 [Caranx melampygus]